MGLLKLFCHICLNGNIFFKKRILDYNVWLYLCINRHSVVEQQPFDIWGGGGGISIWWDYYLGVGGIGASLWLPALLLYNVAGRPSSPPHVTCLWQWETLPLGPHVTCLWQGEHPLHLVSHACGRESSFSSLYHMTVAGRASTSLYHMPVAESFSHLMSYACGRESSLPSLYHIPVAGWCIHVR